MSLYPDDVPAISPPTLASARGAGGRMETALRWAIPASIALHVLFALSIMLLPPPKPPRPPHEDTVSVRILTPEQLGLAPPSEEPPAEENGPAELAATPSPPRPGELVRAERLYSAAALADPRSRRAREALRTLAGDERMIQLCNVEAQEQVHEWDHSYSPDFVVAYAMAGVRISDTAVEAEGAAFRSARNWYNIRYHCQVTPDRKQVVAFEFAVGDEIPKRDWEDHNLTSDDGPQD